MGGIIDIHLSFFTTGLCHGLIIMTGTFFRQLAFDYLNEHLPLSRCSSYHRHRHGHTKALAPCGVIVQGGYSTYFMQSTGTKLGFEGLYGCTLKKTRQLHTYLMITTACTYLSFAVSMSMSA